MQVDGERLWNHLRVLCEEIGPRLSGTDADGRSVEYMVKHLRQCGAQLEVQEYACPAWEHESTEFTLMAAGGAERIPAWAQTFSLACDVEGEIAWVGSREELELAPDLEGKILHHPDEVAQTRALVEIDCVGAAAVPPRVRLNGLGREQTEAVLAVLGEFPRNEVQVPPESEPVRTPLELPGVPTLAFINDYGEVPIHTVQDTIDLIDPGELAHTAATVAGVVQCLREVC